MFVIARPISSNGQCSTVVEQHCRTMSGSFLGMMTTLGSLYSLLYEYTAGYTVPWKGNRCRDRQRRLEGFELQSVS